MTPASPPTEKPQGRQVGVIVHGSLNVAAWVAGAIATGLEVVPSDDGTYTELRLPSPIESKSK